MTVKADLQIAHGVRPRLFLQIDGLQERIWQDDGTGTVPSWDPTGKIGLRPPAELSMSLDVTTCRAEAGAMTFELDDIKDTDGLSWWGKKIAPSAWDAVNKHWRINVGAAAQTYVDANAATIPLKDSTNLPASGTIYIGQETASYTAHATNVMSGVTKGLYPAVADTVTTFGQTYLRPQATDAGYQMHVGSVPFTWHGRRVALYITTYDPENSRYHLATGGNVVWSDAFGDASIDGKWTVDANNGTVAEAGGLLTLSCAVSTNLSWDNTYKNAPLVTLPFAAVGASASELTMAQVTMTQNEVGNLRYMGMGLIEDEENAHWFRINESSGGDEGHFARANLIANVYSIGSFSAGVADAWPCTMRLYYNGTSSAKTIESTTSLAAGSASAWISYAGAAYVLMETWAVGIAPIGYVLSTQNTTGGGSPALDADFDDFTITQYVTAGEGAERLWVGRISNTIKYSPRTCTWSLACESLLADLERKVLNNPHKAAIKGINLTGSKGRRFHITRANMVGNVWATYDCTVAAGWYADAAALAKAIDASLWAAAPGYFSCVKTDATSYKIGRSAGKEAYSSIWRIKPWYRKDKTDYCHALFALGITNTVTADEMLEGNGSFVSVSFEAQKSYADDYHPCSLACNGNKLYVDDAPNFVPNQGDDSVTAGWVKGEMNGIDSGPYDYVAKYSARTTATAADYLTLIVPQYGIPPEPWMHVALRADDDDDAGEISQIYRPCYLTAGGTARGVFEALLYPLLSTGTSGYNHATYDKLPLDMSVGVQADLVDTESFLAADRDLSMAVLTDRQNYYIEKAESWIDLVTRECMIFGYAVCMSRGKLRLRDIMYPSRSLSEVTIDATNRAVRTEAPDTDMPVDTVVNAYEVKVGTAVPIKICDADSVAMFGTREITIEHPGASIATTPADLQRLVSQLLLGRPMRFPSPIVEVTLSPVLMHRVYPGDVVLFKSTCTPDPDGSGSMTVSVYSLVLDAAWNYSTHAGRATLMLLVNYNQTGMPWSPTALVTAHTTAVITLDANEFGKTGDPDDGTAFASGDAVIIVERAPSNRASPQSWTALITDDYGDAGARQFTLDTTLTGYVSTTQYVMVFADYASAVNAQLYRASWQASKSTELLNAVARAYRYG